MKLELLIGSAATGLLLKSRIIGSGRAHNAGTLPRLDVHKLHRTRIRTFRSKLVQNSKYSRTRTRAKILRTPSS